jgi:hypothetical protein
MVGMYQAQSRLRIYKLRLIQERGTMTLQELLGEAYKEGMTAEEIGEIISKMKLADLSKGDYVAKGRLTEAENSLKSIKKEYSDYKASKQTEEEKQAETSAAEIARVQAMEKELAALKAKEQLVDNGFSSEEIKYLMENEQSPSAFAKVMSDRVESASKKSAAQDIKNNVNPPAAGNGKLDVEPASLVEALHEKYDR